MEMWVRYLTSSDKGEKTPVGFFFFFLAHFNQHHQKWEETKKLEKDVELKITSYKEERKWVTKRISMEISNANIKKQLQIENPHLKIISAESSTRKTCRPHWQ